MIDEFKNFVSSRVGKTYNFSRYNCEHLVIDGLKEVYNIHVKELSIDDFIECNESQAQIFSCEDRDGLKCHVGMINDGLYLHAVGEPMKENGQVFAHNVSFFNRAFKPKHTAVRFYKYVSN